MRHINVSAGMRWASELPRNTTRADARADASSPWSSMKGGESPQSRTLDHPLINRQPSTSIAARRSQRADRAFRHQPGTPVRHGPRAHHPGAARGTTAGAPQGHLQGCARWVCGFGTTVEGRQGTRAARCRRSGGRSWLEAEASGDGGAAELGVVEAGGDASGVEGPVGVGEGEPIEVRAKHRSWTRRRTRAPGRAGGH